MSDSAREKRQLTPEPDDADRRPPQKLRMDSIAGEPGREGTPLPMPFAHAGKCIGVFTSGGDCSGNIKH